MPEMFKRATISCRSIPVKFLALLMSFTSCFAFAGETVFINEIHYDNSGGDVGEAIEIAGPAGTDLAGWSLVLYNGSNGTVYNTTALAGVIPNLGASGFGTLAFAIAGIQNGSPDGIALVDPGSAVKQFLSYEGSFNATDGIANGMGSTDIGVSETSGTAIGDSLQLSGTGTEDDDFVWQGPSPDNFGAFNTGQTFGVPIEKAPEVKSTTPADMDTGVATDANIEIIFDEDVDVTVSWFGISCTGSGAHPAVSGGAADSYSLNPTVDFDEGEVCTVTVNKDEVTDTDVDDPPDAMLADYVFSFTTISTADDVPVIINEVDADTPGTDAAEFIELFDGGAGNTALDGLVVVLYNGSDDASYLAFDLDGQTTDADGYFVLCGDPGNVSNCDLDVGAATNLVQNGADAVALYQDDASNFPNDTPVTLNLLIDALVYDTNDGDDAGLAGLLNGGQSQINEGGMGDKDNHSNQRCPNGAGGKRNTGTYTQVPPTPGTANECPLPWINEVDADTPGSDLLEFVELYDGGIGNLPLNGLVLVTFNGSDDQSYNDGYDLDGFSTDSDGYFVIGNAAVPNVDLVIPSNGLQNGADAVALFIGEGADFPNDTPVTTTNLIDALVYDTNDSDDAGLLVLMNAGQPQVNEGGMGDKDNHSNQRCPNGFGGQRNSEAYTQAMPTPGATNTCAPLEIFEIQTSGDASPYAGFSLVTLDNAVTAVGTDGFFMQTPTARSDADNDTSDGIWVFTNGAPGVSVGDRVDVDGMVSENFGFTQFLEPTVSVIGTGDVPAAYVLSAAVPNPDPTIIVYCAIEYECLEGMLVTAPSATVSGGNQSFNSDPIAEFWIYLTGNRPLRETGVEFPGLGGTIPTWDGNPEVFEVDSDKLGLPTVVLAAGSTVTATGGMAYEFGGYEIWASSVTDITSVDPVVPVRAMTQGEMTVGSLNLLNLFASNGDFANRIVKFSSYIRTVLMSPDILAVQEVGSINELDALAAQINTDDPSVSYTPYLVGSNSNINVGFLIRQTVAMDAVTQLGADEILDYDGINNRHDRPPLLFEGRYKGNGHDFKIGVLVVHMRSLINIEDPSDGDRVRHKRLEQAQSVAQMVQDFQTENSGVPFIVVGDFNAFQHTDGYVDVVGQMRGDVDAAQNLLSGPDLVDPNLTNQVDFIDPGQQYSFVFLGNANALDHALTNDVADPFVRGLEYGRGNADAAHDSINELAIPLRSSDHDGLVLYLMTDKDGDGVPDDVDACPFDSSNSSVADCAVSVPALSPISLLLLLLMMGGLGVYTIRYRPGLIKS